MFFDRFGVAFGHTLKSTGHSSSLKKPGLRPACAGTDGGNRRAASEMIQIARAIVDKYAKDKTP